MRGTRERIGRSRFASALLAAVLAAFVFAPAAFAQSPAAQARALFLEGVDLAERGDWALATQKFEGALALHDSPAVRFNLAQSLEHVGRLVDALSHLDNLEAGGTASRAIRASAAELREQIEPRIGRLVITLRGDTTDAVVRFRGTELPAASIGSSMPVDPGAAHVRLERAGTVLDETDVAIPEGGVAHVVLARQASETPAEVAPTPVEVAAVDAQRNEEAPRTRPIERDDQSMTSSPWFWVAIGGVAVAGVVVGVLIASSGGSEPTQGDFDMPVLEF